MARLSANSRRNPRKCYTWMTTLTNTWAITMECSSFAALGPCTCALSNTCQISQPRKALAICGNDFHCKSILEDHKDRIEICICCMSYGYSHRTCRSWSSTVDNWPRHSLFSTIRILHLPSIHHTVSHGGLSIHKRSKPFLYMLNTQRNCWNFFWYSRHMKIWGTIVGLDRGRPLHFCGISSTFQADPRWPGHEIHPPRTIAHSHQTCSSSSWLCPRWSHSVGNLRSKVCRTGAYISMSKSLHLYTLHSTIHT